MSWEDRKTLGRALPNDEDRLREVSQHYWWWPTSPTTPEALARHTTPRPENRRHLAVLIGEVG